MRQPHTQNNVPPSQAAPCTPCCQLYYSPGVRLRSLPLPLPPRDPAVPLHNWRVLRRVSAGVAGQGGLSSSARLGFGFGRTGGGQLGWQRSNPLNLPPARVSCRLWPPWMPTPPQSAPSSSTSSSK